MKTVPLGTIDLPDGVLVILDPGLARFWRHDDDPTSPRAGDPPTFDLEIVGRDAETAGRKYDRSPDPLYLFDVEHPVVAKARFETFAREGGYRASARVLDERIPHTERARRARLEGYGLGVVMYNGLWAVAVGGFEPGASLLVRGVPMPSGDFEARFESIELVTRDDVEPVRSERVSGVMVEHGQLLFAGLGPLGAFKARQPADGLADYVFWGSDAETLAWETGASALEDGLFGWRDIPMNEVGEKAGPLQRRVEAEDLQVTVDFRPHCNLERMNAAMRASKEDTAELEIGGARIVGCGNRWGDGIFEVSRHVDDSGLACLVRIELATPERLDLVRRVIMRRKAAIVTSPIIEGGEPVRFGERYETNRKGDSGWCFSSGAETPEDMEVENLHLVPISYLLALHPELEQWLLHPSGTLIRADEDDFVLDE